MTSVEYVTDLALSTSVDVLISQMEIVIVTETCSMSAVFAAVTASLKVPATATATSLMRLECVVGIA